MQEKKYLDIISILAIFLLTLILRYPYAAHPTLDWDESVYIDIASRIMDGDMPYRDAWDHKPPLIYYIFESSFILFGKSISGVHVFTIFYIAVTGILMYIIVNRMWGIYAGIFAGMSYPIFLESDIIQGLASNTEIFVNLPIIVGIYFFMNIKTNTVKENRYILLILSGLFIGIAVLIKQPAVFILFTFFIFLFLERYRSDYKFKDILSSSFLILFGFLIPIIIAIFYFYFNDAFSDFIYSNIYYNAKYVSTTDTPYFINGFIDSGKKITTNLFLLFILTLGSIIYRLKEKNLYFSDNFSFMILWLIFSMIGIFSGTKFYLHYYIQLIPSMIFLSSYFIKAISETDMLNSIFKIIFVIFLVLGLIFPMSNNIKKIPFLLNGYDNIIKGAKYDASIVPILKANGEDSYITPFAADYRSYFIGEYIKLNSNKTDYVFVWGNHPVIYFLSDRKSATKYVHWIHIDDKLIQNSEEYTIQELISKKPKYIVYQKTPSEFDKTIINLIKSTYTPDISINDIYLFKYGQ